MAPKKKPPARSQRSRSASKKANPIHLFIWPLLALACLCGLGYLWYKSQPVSAAAFQIGTIENLCIAAGIDTDTEILRKDGDPTRWYIQYQASPANRLKQDNFLKSILKSASDRNLPKIVPEKRNKDHSEFTIVELPLESEKRLRIIFELELPSSPPAKANPPNHALATKPKPIVNSAQPEKASTALPEAQIYEAETPPVHLGDNSDAHPNANLKRPLIAVIIDDVGLREVSHLQSILNTKLPITFAILPYLPNSASNAIYFYQNHYEVMLHMPMEPDNFPKNNPGEGALFTNLSETEIRVRIDRALRSVPYVVGVNNHMGSKMTANRTLMGVVLSEIQKHNLYFVDSRTNSASVGFRIAKNLGMRTAERNVFLDAENTYEFALKQLDETRRIARHQGYAILIGHPHPGSLRALSEEMPKMDKEGFQFVFASKIVRNYANSPSEL